VLFLREDKGEVGFFFLSVTDLVLLLVLILVLLFAADTTLTGEDSFCGNFFCFFSNTFFATSGE